MWIFCRPHTKIQSLCKTDVPEAGDGYLSAKEVFVTAKECNLNQRKKTTRQWPEEAGQTPNDNRTDRRLRQNWPEPNLLAAQTYFFNYPSFFVQLRVVFGGRNSVTFRWDTCVFVPYVEQFCRILSVSYALSASRYFIRNWFRLIISYPSWRRSLVRLSGKIKWHFFYILRSCVFFSSQASHAPANLPVFTIATHACGGSMCLRAVLSLTFI